MPNGIVNTNPLAMVKQKDMQGLYFMMREEGMTPEEVYSYARSSSISAGTWDEDFDGPALKMAIKQISEQGWRPKMNQQVMDYNMQGTYDRKQKNVRNPKIDLPENFDESGSAVKT